MKYTCENCNQTDKGFLRLEVTGAMDNTGKIEEGQADTDYMMCRDCGVVMPHDELRKVSDTGE